MLGYLQEIPNIPDSNILTGETDYSESIDSEKHQINKGLVGVRQEVMHVRRKWKKRADQTLTEAKNSRRRNSRRETEKTSSELMGRDKNILLSKQSGCLSVSRSASTHAHVHVHKRCSA